MSEFKPKKNNKRCILTEIGKQKLEDKLKGLKKQYPEKYNTSDLARITSLDRGTVKKILEYWNKQPVTYSCLYQFFQAIEIPLNEEDYENPPKQEAKKPQKQNNESINLKYGINDLKNALQQLDYEEQRYLFKQSIEQVEPVTTFFIYGKKHYGQKWLVNLLRYKYLPLHTTDVWQHSLIIDRKQVKNIQNLWRKL